MPVVPTYEESVPSDAPVIRSKAQDINPAAFGGAVTEGAAHVSDALDHLGEINDEASAKQLAVEYSTFEREALYGKSGLFNLQNAQALGAIPAVQKALTDKREELLGQTANRRQQMMLGDNLDVRLNASMESIDRFGIDQTHNYAKATSAAVTADHVQNYITLLPTNPEEAHKHLQAALDEQDKLSASLGIGDDDAGHALKNQARLDVTTEAHTGVLANMLANHDEVGAAAYFQANQLELDPKNRAIWGDKVFTASTQAGALKAVNNTEALFKNGGLAGGPPVGTPSAASTPGTMPKGAFAGHIRQVSFAVGGATRDEQDYLVITNGIEASGGAHPKANGSHIGAFQFDQKTFERILPGGDINNPDDQIHAALLLERQNKAILTERLGRDPTTMELYLAHQQGVSGATALLIANPMTSAAEALAPMCRGGYAEALRRVKANGGSETTTVGQFLGIWHAQVQKRSGQALAGGPADTGAYQPSGFAGGAPAALPDREAFINAAVAQAPPGPGHDQAAEMYRQAASGRWEEMHAAQSDKQREATDAVQPILRNPDVKTYAQFVAATPPDVLASIPQTTLTSISDGYERNGGGSPYAKKSDPLVLSALFTRFGDDPVGFMDVPLADYVGKLDEGHYTQLLAYQAQLRQGRGVMKDRAKQQTIGHMMSVGRPMLLAAGVNPRTPSGKKQVAMFQSLMITAVDDWRGNHGGREPELADLHAMADTLLLNAKVDGGGWFGGEKSETVLAAVTEGKTYRLDIPAGVRATLSARFRATHGGEAPTEQQLQQGYRALHASGKVQ